MRWFQDAYVVRLPQKPVLRPMASRLRGTPQGSLSETGSPTHAHQEARPPAPATTPTTAQPTQLRHPAQPRGPTDGSSRRSGCGQHEDPGLPGLGGGADPHRWRAAFEEGLAVVRGRGPPGAPTRISQGRTAGAPPPWRTWPGAPGSTAGAPAMAPDAHPPREPAHSAGASACTLAEGCVLGAGRGGRGEAGRWRNEQGRGGEKGRGQQGRARGLTGCGVSWRMLHPGRARLNSGLPPGSPPCGRPSVPTTLSGPAPGCARRPRARVLCCVRCRAFTAGRGRGPLGARGARGSALIAAPSAHGGGAGLALCLWGRHQQYHAASGVPTPLPWGEPEAAGGPRKGSSAAPSGLCARRCCPAVAMERYRARLGGGCGGRGGRGDTQGAGGTRSGLLCALGGGPRGCLDRGLALTSASVPGA